MNRQYTIRPLYIFVSLSFRRKSNVYTYIACCFHQWAPLHNSSLFWQISKRPILNRNTDIFRTQLHTRCIVQQMIKAHESSRHAIRITSIHLCNFNAINILLSCQISCVVYMFCECMSEFGVQLQSGTTYVQRNFVCSCGGSDSELSPVRKSTRKANIYYNLIRKKFDKHSNFILSKY